MKSFLLKNVSWQKLSKGCVRLFALLLIVSWSCITSQASQLQPAAVGGTVRDSKGEPLPGVSVRIKGESKGQGTDVNGKYKIEASGKQVLVFTYIGYISQEVAVNGRNVVDVILLEDSKKLEEVLVVGYGTQKKSDITGALSSIKAKDLKDIPAVSVEELFKGQAAGVQSSVTSGAPGAASNINIRGVSSIGAGTQPLYVVDGLPVIGESLSSKFAESRTVMDFINPNDIQSIEILKDASATAIYGARAANGVVLITTKTGKGQPNKVTFAASGGVSTLANPIKMMTTRENQAYWEAAKLRNGIIIDPLDQSYLDINTNWQDVTSQAAGRQQYNVNFQGGQTTDYYLSFDYLKQDGILRYTDHKRLNFLGNIGSQVTKKLRVENRLNALQSNNEGSFTGGEARTPETQDVIARIIGAPSYRIPLDGSSTVDPLTGESYVDPLIVLKDLSDDIQNVSLTEELILKFDVTKNLKFQSTGGISYRFISNDQYQGPLYTATKKDTRITAETYDSDRRNLVNENTLTFQKNFNARHDVTLLAGNTLQTQTTAESDILAIGFPNATTGVNALQNATDRTVSSNKERWQLASFFGRVNYNYNNKYLFSGTLRTDGSSKFGLNNKWGTFPSAALAWRISEEKFAKKYDWLKSLKLRGSWGQIGNSEIGVYQTLSTLSSGTTPISNVLQPAYVTGKYGDPNLKWEVSEQTDLGFDLELFNSRITLTADVYSKDTKDLLLNQPTPLSSGYTNYLTNIGSMRNKGLEITLGTQNITGPRLSWSSNINMSFLKNRVTSIGNASNVPIGATIDNKFPRYLTPGKSIGTYFLVKTNGIWQTGEETQAAVYKAKPGDRKYVDQDNNGVIDNGDRIFTGDGLPHFSWGFSNTVTYKSFDLLFLFTGDHGHQTLNAVKPHLWQAQKSGGAAYNLNAWSVTNPTNDLPAATTVYNSEFLHDGYLEDADVIRLQNVKLGYRFKKFRPGLPAMYVYFSGSNVLSWSSYDGFDPEVGSGISRGIDRFSYPRSRSFNLGVQASF